MRALLWSVLLLWLWESPGWAVVTFDAVSTGLTNPAATSLTFAHTVGAGCADAVLYVLFGNDIDTDVVTGVTYAGQAMTRVTFLGHTGQGMAGYMYRRIAPTKGSLQNVVISQTATEGIAATAISVCGAHQTTPERASDTALAFTPNWSSPTIASSADDLVLGLLVGGSSSQTFAWTSPAGIVERSEVVSATNQTVAASTGTVPGTAGTITLSGTGSGTVTLTAHMVSVQAASALATRRRIVIHTE